MGRPQRSILVLILGILPVPAAGTDRGWKLRDDRKPNQEVVLPLPWDRKAAAHLMRRAGFDAPLPELDRMVQQGFETSLDLLIDYEGVDDSELDRGLHGRYALVREQETGTRTVGLNLQRWWFYRMLNSRRQLLEKMTFFWHDHFATSLLTVPFANGQGESLMWLQNETLRTHALGNFKEMVQAIAKDPAMIVWLDSYANIVGSPNENWARELMELFTMGEGSGYTEQDIQEAARAFTGWTLVPPRSSTTLTLAFQFVPRLHDYGVKIFLGRTVRSRPGGAGVEDGDEVIDIIFEQPVVAEFIARKAWEFFVYPEPSAEIIAGVAQLFRDSGYEIRALMRAIFDHPHFMSMKAYRAKIKSPVEFVVGVFRQMEVGDPDNLPRAMFGLGLGQDLFYPPDVGGWTADQGWLNTGTILGRYNFLTLFTGRRPGGHPDRAQDQIDVHSILADHHLALASHVIDHFLERLVQGDVSADTRQALEEYMESAPEGFRSGFDVNDPTLVDMKVRGLIYLIGLIPVYQLN